MSLYAFVLSAEVFFASLGEDGSDAAGFLKAFAGVAAVLAVLAALPVALRIFRHTAHITRRAGVFVIIAALVDAGVLWYLYETGHNSGWS